MLMRIGLLCSRGIWGLQMFSCLSGGALSRSSRLLGMLVSKSLLLRVTPRLLRQIS
ncbi:hypothetical protein AAZX31_19G078300 [Glycine max]